jgi:hypothetical protein
VGTLFAVFRMCLKSEYKHGTTDLLRSTIVLLSRKPLQLSVFEIKCAIHVYFCFCPKHSNKVEVEPDKNFLFTSSQIYGLGSDCFKKAIVTPVTGDQICVSGSFNCRKDFC